MRGVGGWMCMSRREGGEGGEMVGVSQPNETNACISRIQALRHWLTSLSAA